MNLSGFVDEDNTTFQPFDVNVTTDQLQYYDYYDHDYIDYAVYAYDFAPISTLRTVIVYICIVLGIPGNILSAIIWLRRQVASKNSSAVYLASLAINDLVHLLPTIIEASAIPTRLFYSLLFLFWTTASLEPLLVLGFSVERLIAISCPLKVSFIRIHCEP